MITTRDCPEIESWQALLDANLPADQRAQLEQHLDLCPVCQDRLDRASEGEEELRRCARRVGDPTVATIDTSLSHFLERMYEANVLDTAFPAEPPDLYFLYPSDQPELLGTLGDYEVREVIGQGGMGLVLKAYEPALHRLVAIKVLAAAVAGSATARRRFTREAQAAAAVCHDHIVAVHGVHEIDGLPCLVMQYIAGESLQERLDRVGSLEVEEIVRIGLQTAAGLAAAHAQGLVHRDIKPANLLLENNLGNVKITDFGLARMSDDVQLTQAGVIAGTPEYMAPEQARGDQVDRRADLFSLGGVLYACCTGMAPFHGKTSLALLHAVNNGVPIPLCQLNPNIPAWLEALIAWLMAKEPERRCQSAAEIANLLEGYLAHLKQPTVVPAPALPSISYAGAKDRPSRSAGWPSFALLILLVLALVGSVTTFLLFGLGNQNENAAPKDAPPDPYVVWSVAISSDNKVVAAGAGWWTSDGEVGVWDLATQKPLQHFAQDRGVVSVAFSPNSKLLAFAGWTHHVHVVDWANNREIADFPVYSLAHVAFSPDGSLLATASEGQTLQLWDLAKGELATDLEGDLLRFHRVIFSIDGKRLLAGGGDWQPGGINHLGVWDVASKKQVLKLAGHANTVYCIACSPDGKTIATGSVDRTIRLWDAETGQFRKTLRGRMREVDSLVFTADSKTLLSSGPESIVRFWDLEQGKETSQLDTGISHVRAMCLTADDKTLVVGGQQKTLKIFNLETRKQVAVLWNGGDPKKLDMDELPASPAKPADTPKAAEGTRSYVIVLFLTLGFTMAMAAGMIIWFLAHHRRRPDEAQAQAVTPKPSEEKEPVEAMISFKCSACGTTLKTRRAFRGKKVTCSKCRQRVCVPTIDAQEPI